MKMPFEGLSKQRQQEVLELSRYKQNIVVTIEDMGVIVTLPEFFPIRFVCSDEKCKSEYFIRFKNVDWIYLTNIKPIPCAKDGCEGICPQIYET